MNISDDEPPSGEGRIPWPRLWVVGLIQRSFGVSSIALTGLFILAVFNAVYFMRSILLRIESDVSRTAINAWLRLAVGTARSAQPSWRDSPLAARALSRRSRSCRNLFYLVAFL